jgi:outer membrane protein OmpA-like peptidoglycan-associated protein
MGKPTQQQRGLPEAARSTANKGTANRHVDAIAPPSEGYVVSYPSKDEPPQLAGRRIVQVLFAGFPVNKSTLTSAHRRGLETLAEVMNYEGGSFIPVIRGRASQTGPEGNNARLSNDRAMAIATGLNALGIPSGRIYGVEALGSASPLRNVPGQEIDLNRSASVAISLQSLVPPPAPKIEPPRRGSENWEIAMSFSASVTAGIGASLAFGVLRAQGSPTYHRIRFIALNAGIPGRSASISPPSWTAFRTRARYGIRAFDGEIARISSLGINPVGVGYSAVRLTFTHVSDESIQLSGVNFGSVGYEANVALGIIQLLDEVRGDL